MLKLILIAFTLLIIPAAGIAIKMFFIKGTKFKKTRASSLPGENLSCTCGGEGSYQEYIGKTVALSSFIQLFWRADSQIPGFE
ncbi:MAG TPA: hypothetical protein PK028_03430 [Bacteroidales bacterium]|jgi:hypothetical protein|nr:hypothetical protein [Bacteroidales bacterium]MDI9573436.1 hypothetical protein [Bacteroidota bacterium]OQC61867.1 MAG: hypothetical protein BWX51_00008 [Bacteroidetes bacterium ADurb.Bin012]MBP9511239.1 hypothetical protein [Bacteroidales bacterium]HNQ59680.1 hypothetical protein [Bacteroidales bacterium]